MHQFSSIHSLKNYKTCGKMYYIPKCIFSSATLVLNTSCLINFKWLALKKQTKANVGLHMQCVLLSHFDYNWNVPNFNKTPPLLNFMQICSATLKVLNIDRQGTVNWCIFCIFHCKHTCFISWNVCQN